MHLHAAKRTRSESSAHYGQTIRHAAGLLLIAFAALLGAGVSNAQTLSMEARLFALGVAASGNALTLSPSFNSNTTSYETTAGASETEATIVAAHGHASQTFEYLDFSNHALTDASTAANFQVSLTVGDNIVKIKVTAEDGVTTKTYTVNIRRPSTVARLITLSVDNQATGTALTMTPSFSVSITSYAATAGPSVSQIRILAFTAHRDATIEYLDSSDNTLTDLSTTDIGFQHNLSVGDNIVKMKITAEDGVTTKTYTLTIRRLSDDATLGSLSITDSSLNPVSLSPAFNASNSSYEATVGEAVSEITITATTAYSDASIEYLDASDNTLADASTSTPGFQMSLVVGDNIISIKVTAEDGSTTETYTLKAIRLDETAPTLTSASISSPFNYLRLTYDEALDSTSIPNKSAFEVRVQQALRTLHSTSLPNTNEIVLTLVSAPRPGDTVTVSYTVPSMSPIQDAAGNKAAGFTGEAVANNIAAKSPERPDNLTATPSGSDSMILSWTTPWANGSDITSYDVRYIAGTSVGGIWTEIDGSDASTTSHTVTGLTPGDEYTFQIRAVNGIGNGSGARVTETVTAATWALTLTDLNGNNVTELTEGGDSATATVSITNNVTFSTDQTVTLKWGPFDLRPGGGDSGRRRSNHDHHPRERVQRQPGNQRPPGDCGPI